MNARESRLFEIKKSAIAGKGVFAKKEIRKGQRITFLRGERCTLETMLKRVIAGKEKGSDPLGIDDEVYLDLEETARTFNHSCGPNAYVQKKNELVALRTIHAGEEITYDYSTTMNDNKQKINAAGRRLWKCKCYCGSKNCRGIINQFKTLPKKRQLYYIKNKFMPDFMLNAFKPHSRTK